MKEALKSLLTELITIIGKPIKGNVFLSKNKERIVVKHTSFTSAQLSNLSTLAKDCSPDWEIILPDGKDRAFADLTLIGPPGGHSEEDILDAFCD
jgi:hypothetical protein